jgi:hypothetical protein
MHDVAAFVEVAWILGIEPALRARQRRCPLTARKQVTAEIVLGGKQHPVSKIAIDKMNGIDSRQRARELRDWHFP